MNLETPPQPDLLLPTPGTGHINNLKNGQVMITTYFEGFMACEWLDEGEPSNLSVSRLSWDHDSASGEDLLSEHIPPPEVEYPYTAGLSQRLLARLDIQHSIAQE